jgi:hypothetical protein
MIEVKLRFLYEQFIMLHTQAEDMRNKNSAFEGDYREYNHFLLEQLTRAEEDIKTIREVLTVS